ncbi:MAG: DUF502 domain-containing protein [Syntrophales bacterium]|jgi:uncharacterized membrane protein|nr:DUF502 domain-containing protein [Syntrophales bacterium]MDY0045132.1 DUF502 domain-containing protein [Syntrophales bacterium]
MKNKIKKIFLTGIVAIIPIGVTVYILIFLVRVMGKLVKVIPPKFHPDQLFPFHIPGLDVVITIILIFLIGLVTKSYIGNKLVEWGEFFLGKIPVVRTIYTGVKTLVEAIFGDKSQSFKRVVIIEYPRKGLYSVAFVTGVSSGEMQEKTTQHCINIFLPTTPNPTSGFYLMVPETDVIDLDMSVDEAFTLIISGGVFTPEKSMREEKAKEMIHADNI